MKSWILNESPGAYTWGDIATPGPQEDQVRIRVVASALNHMDLWVTRGMPKPPLPHIPGCDVAGIVDAIGSRVTTVKVGDEVVVNPGVSPIGRHSAVRQQFSDGTWLHDLGRALSWRSRHICSSS